MNDGVAEFAFVNVIAKALLSPVVRVDQVDVVVANLEGEKGGLS